MPVFLNPLFLAAMAAVAVPIALHLLHRRNPKPIPFSTLRFLQAAVARTRRARRLTQILVLLLRVLIIAALAAAFAQPRIRAGRWLPEGARTVVLVIDSSLSMHTRDGGQARFEAATEWARDLLGTLSDRDQVAILLPGSDQPRALWPPVSNRAQAERLLHEVTPGHGAVNLPASIKDLIGPWLDEQRLGGIELHVFSDFQSSTWGRADAEVLAEKVARHDLTLFLNDVSAPAAANAWIQDLRLQPEALLGQGDVLARITVQTDARFEGPSLVRLLEDQTELAQRGVNLTANNKEDLALSASFGAGNIFALGKVVLDDDALPEDNTRVFALERRESIQVLLVNGGPAPHDTLNDAFFLRRAFNPQQLPTPLIQTSELDFQALAGADLGRFEMVLVCNPPAMDASLALRLEHYVERGGILVLYPGDRGGLLASYRQFKPLAGLEIQAERLLNARSFRFIHTQQPSELEKRANRLLGRLPEFSGTQRLIIRQPPTGSTTFYHLESDTPAMLQVSHGRGSFWIGAMTANRAWSEWPLQPGFVIFHQLLARAGLGGTHRTLQAEVGSTVELPWAGPELLLRVQVKPPEGPVEPLVLERATADRPFFLARFPLPGLYRLELQAERPEIRWVAVYPPLAESRLESLTEAEMLAAFPGVTPLISRGPAAQKELLTTLTRGQPLWPWLLLLAFLLAILEALFANWRSWHRPSSTTLQQVLGGARA